MTGEPTDRMPSCRWRVGDRVRFRAVDDLSLASPAEEEFICGEICRIRSRPYGSYYVDIMAANRYMYTVADYMLERENTDG